MTTDRETLVREIQPETWCGQHAPEYGYCVDCESDTERIVDRILASDWLRERDRATAEKALRQSHADISEHANTLTDALLILRRRARAAASTPERES